MPLVRCRWLTLSLDLLYCPQATQVYDDMVMNHEALQTLQGFRLRSGFKRAKPLKVRACRQVGGLTRPDVILAAKLDAVPVEYSPKWLRENAPTA